MTSSGQSIDLGMPPPTSTPAEGAPAAANLGGAVELVAAVDPFALASLPPTWRDRVRTDLQILAVLVERLRAAVAL
jgi:hypothetical protein